jgi:uncharacterized protein (TIGR03086 family)
VVCVDDLAHAQTAVAALLAAVTPEEWARPSPCDGWDVAGVARHLVVGERVFTTALGGSAYDLPAVIAEIAAIGDEDLPATYAQGGVRLREALAAADPAGAYPTGLGPMSVPAVDQLRTIEALVHGWDAGRGAGRLLEVDKGVAERAIEHSLALIDRLPPERTPFAPPVEIADDAPAIDRLAALLGRSVSG